LFVALHNAAAALHVEHALLLPADMLYAPLNAAHWQNACSAWHTIKHNEHIVFMYTWTQQSTPKEQLSHCVRT
jgi:hypothetical protein